MAKNSHSDRIFLVFHGRFPSEKAAALFVAKSAASFADLGKKVTLLVPRRFGRFKESCFDFYGLPENFKVVFLPTVDVFQIPVLNRFAFQASFFCFSIFLFFYLLFFSARKSDIIYSNETLPLLFASLIFPNTVYEIHDFPKNNYYYRTVFSRINKFVSTNRWKMEKLREMFKTPVEKIITEMNAVSLEDFSAAITTEEARKKLNLPLEAELICYVGTLRTMGMEKGIGAALEALKLLPENVRLLLVGGHSGDIFFYKAEAAKLGVSERVIFDGFVPHKKVALYLQAADILIAPFPKTPHYEHYMSPMKIFEYMAVKRPIVASDLVSIHEILPLDGALFVAPDNPNALAAAIQKLLADRELGGKFAQNALRAVSEHTWKKRASRINEFLNSRFDSGSRTAE